MKEKFYITLFMLTGIVHVIHSENGKFLPKLIYNESLQTSNLDPSIQYKLGTEIKEPLKNKHLNKRQNLNMNADDDINSQGSAEYITIKNFSTGANVRTFERQNEEYNCNCEENRPFDEEMSYFNRNEHSGFGQDYRAHEDSESKFGWEKKGQGGQSILSSKRIFQQYALNDFSNAKDFTDNTKYSTTSISDHYINKKQENSNNKLLINMHSNHPVHSSSRYQNINDRSNLNQYRNDKGLVINFNTECPTPLHTNNRFVYKYILMPNSRLASQVETTPFQISDAAVISSTRMTNPIYCY